MTFSPFDRLKLDKELACEFLGVFSRLECALKECGFVSGDGNRVKADWRKFAGNINKEFAAIDDGVTKAARDYLLNFPPKKQVLRNGNVQWVDIILDPNWSSAESTLFMIRQVRNNLFHGGKFLKSPESVNDRDKLLVKNSLIVLYACISFHDCLKNVYES